MKGPSLSEWESCLCMSEGMFWKSTTHCQPYNGLLGTRFGVPCLIVENKNQTFKRNSPSQNIQTLLPKKAGKYLKKHHENKQTEISFCTNCKFTIKIPCCTETRVLRDIKRDRFLWITVTPSTRLKERPLTFTRRLPPSLDVSNIVKGHSQNISTDDNLLFAYNSGFTVVVKQGAVRRGKGQREIHQSVCSACVRHRRP